MECWGYYGLPKSAQAAYRGKIGGIRPVGEVRYVVGWAADQMVRMGWRVTIDDSETWRLTLSSGETVVSDSEEDDTEAETHPANASRRLLREVGWNEGIARQVTTNLFVAGELWYLATGGTWAVASVIAPDLFKRVKAADMAIRGLWPHPADPDSPDAPLSGVTDVLDDLLWLSRLSRSQSSNRVSMRGIVGVADTLQLAQGGTAEQFWADFQAALSRPMDDPTDVSPVGLRGPAELIKAEGAGGNSMAGLTWVIPDFPYDERIDARMDALIHRLAYGLPIPPEIIFGIVAASRATAFQMEGSAYRAHVEPMAWTVARIPQDALAALLPEVGNVRIVPDPTAILARRHSVSDVLEAFDRGAVGFDYLREALGIPPRAEPSEEDMRRRSAMGSGVEAVDGVTADPADVAAAEPVNAAVMIPAGEMREVSATGGTDSDERLASTLARIDDLLLSELVGAATQAVLVTRQRLGAAVRSRSKARGEIPADLDNADLVLRIGPDALAELGIDVTRTVEGGITPTLTWWGKRAVAAQADVSAIFEALGGDGPSFDLTLLAESSALLGATLRSAIFDSSEVSTQALREVISLAGS